MFPMVRPLTISPFDSPFNLSQDPLNSLDQPFDGLLKGSLNNWFSSVNAYSDMSPDLTIRQQVNQWMKGRSRELLSEQAWCRLFCRYQRMYPVLMFIYQRFSEYSGLEFGRVRPGDRLHSDLHFPLICWFDWSTTFCEDFFQRFGVDLSDRFDEDGFETIDQLVNFLIEQAMPQAVAITQGGRTC
ncbi:MAG: hypothetical protein HC800_20700 [Phormidesmis sp. RL_2_1]|nr:hypothetical protein [Phormidesmis sp. RL_2_1]